MTTHDSPNPGMTEEEPPSEALTVPGEFPAEFTVEELIELGEDENWDLITFNKIEDDDISTWDFAYETPAGVTIIMFSQPDTDLDEVARNLNVLGGRVHVTDYDVYTDIAERMNTVTNGKSPVGLPETIAEKLNHTSGERLSESQFNDLFTVTGWPHDEEATIDHASVGLQSRQYLHNATIERFRETVTTIESIHNDYESKLNL